MPSHSLHLPERPKPKQGTVLETSKELALQPLVKAEQIAGVTAKGPTSSLL